MAVDAPRRRRLRQSKQTSTRMKLGARLPRALAVAAVAAVTVVPLAASAAGAAPVAPTAYTVFGSAQPLVWGAASSLPVGDLRVPFVWGKTNNLAVASANAALSVPDGNPTTPKPMSGDSISGLTCTGYAENFCKDPFTLLDNPAELHRAELRLANAGPSEQEAYDGAKVLLKKLKDRGIVLDHPNFDAQLTKTPAHVTDDTQGLVVHFEQAVGSVEASAFSYPLNLGHATAVVIALNTDGKTDVTQNPNGSVTVQSPPPAASAPPPIPPRPTQGSGPSKPGINSGGNPGKSAKPGSGGPRDTVPSS